MPNKFMEKVLNIIDYDICKNLQSFSVKVYLYSDQIMKLFYDELEVWKCYKIIPQKSNIVIN